MKIENQSRKRSQAGRNRSRKNQNVSISCDSVYDSVAYDPVKTGLSESEAEAEEPTHRKARNRTLSLVYFFRFCFSATPIMQFSLDRNPVLPIEKVRFRALIGHL